jgi:putative SOS response-associated peptidase YedK
MPVILAAKDYDLWLNPQMEAPEPLQQLLLPYPAAAMTAYSVSTLVNNSRHNSPECIIPLKST